jgi:DNA mismatch repair protein MutL
LGFRGEALPSIAAVAKVRLTTARREDRVGTRLHLSGGAITRVEDAAASPGTQVEVADLFFNVPARRKFLKTTATEFSHVCQAVQQAALAWPRTHFRLLHNGQPVLDLPAVASRRTRVGQVYGEAVLERMVAVQAAQPGLALEGFAVGAVEAKAGRTPQDLFVNRRWVKNPTVQHAVYDGYGTSLARGRQPLYVLFLDVDPERVDVNVHPAKREVRFAEPDRLHQLVRRAVREALGLPLVEGAAAPRPGAPGRSAGVAVRPTGGWELRGSEAGAGGETAVSGGQAVLPGYDPGTREPAEAAQEAAGTYRAVPDREVLPLGQISRTFLVAQVGAELQVIDQHTAHERVLFERLWRSWRDRAVPTQPLLIPETIELPPAQAVLLRERLGDLAALGLEVDPFGATAFLIRSAPALLGRLDTAALVRDLLDDLTQWKALTSIEARVRPILASLACHGAVRAGRPMEPAQSRRLIEDWVAEGLPMTCPHGRRVALRLPEEELARIFGRA